MKLNVDYKHIALLALSAFFGAWVSSLQGDAGLLSDLQHWKTAQPDLVAALAAGLLSVANQARKSFLQLMVPPGPGTLSSTQATTVPPPAGVIPSSLKFQALAGLTGLLMGCTLAAQLPAVIADVSTIATDVVQDVQKGMAPEAIIADILAKTGAQDEAIVISVVESLLAAPDLATHNPELIAPLQNLDTAAVAKLAARKAALPHATLIVPANPSAWNATALSPAVNAGLGFREDPYCTPATCPPVVASHLVLR